MWGKGKRLEIHNNPLNHSAIVRIQSEYLRQKILDKNIWYVGDSMFHTAQWSSAHFKATPPLKAIKICAHLTGVPLDLRHDEGLSFVAGLVSEPKQTDEFTKNLWRSLYTTLGYLQNVAAGEPPDPLPVPPDPHNPSSPLSPNHFPTLSEAKTVPRSAKTSYRSVTPASTTCKGPNPSTASDCKATADTETTEAASPVTEVVFPPSTDPVHGSGKNTVLGAGKEFNLSLNQNLQTLPPRTSSPLLTNTASSPNNPNTGLNQSPIQAHSTETLNPTLREQTAPTTEPSVAPKSMTAPPSLVERIRRSEDKTLRRLAPLSIGATGRPRVLIPDSVFQKRAELHKYFIICYFNGKAPPFNQIQSVFNHMWGKGKRLEIHNNPLNHSAIVRIQSEYLRQKIFDKSIWYVGDSMFYIAQWSSAHSKATPPLKAIKIWAHLTGVPLDLRHNEGLSFVSGLVGGGGRYKTAFDVVDFEREDGEVMEVSVHYPRVPPKCTHCQELSHITRNCLSYTPPPNEPEGAKKKAHVNKTAPAQNKKYRPVTQGTKNRSSTPLPYLTLSHPYQAYFSPYQTSLKAILL
ncbi:hypothetical protein DY000_02047102 [Brassica cretica]|uniref:DUF4283 domain-containing protein n=1 Tax=Brassica cretica TaxID=69181 RepID=A0ABQ7F1M3_BRACR|nr:hypothetical protein DY000_02047102 [Brassica cretica]